MMRRSHRKSRNGCLECKKRHIKCDESRPQCLNCTTVERKCQYSTPWRATERSPSDGSASPQIPSTGPTLVPSPAPDPSGAVFPDLQHLLPPDGPHSSVNMVHMELFHHYMTQQDVYHQMEGSMKDVIVAVALREPYVMLSVLALSAYHLGVVRPPERRAFYRDLAVQLQTDALSLFNSIDLAGFGDSVEKRIPVFIFSCILGFHALCDTMTHRDPRFEEALARYVSYVRLHRGMHTVMRGYWDEVRKTELKVIFDEMVPQWFQIVAEGHECDDIRARIAGAELDDEEERKAMQAAVDLLQWVFDARPIQSRVYVLCAFVAMLSPPLVNMVETLRPEALAILAYYFLAIHYCSDAWNFGGAGRHFLTLIADHLHGGPWYAWVEPPWRKLQESLEAAGREEGEALMARPFETLRPCASDAPRIAAIHLAAMHTNPLLHAQFPTAASLAALEGFLTAYATAQLQDNPSGRGGGGGALIARDRATGEVVAFARWDSPREKEGDSSGIVELEGCRREFLEGYAVRAEEAMGRLWGGREGGCYRLSFVCTDPAYQGQGAGSLLTRRVLELAAEDGLPVYLESTEVAVGMYEKLGFRKVGGFGMKIPGEGGEVVVYREVCMVREPSAVDVAEGER
ncbi:acyl-CoA N-acyltransferase [Staphylotrichum tortipilum]|uniref:Acyl-CoA N-acyltransferase n=1 Tax=Staphylotrichum tortipilum TaxID=2831512 RepID=A0AAN6RWM7_9PEZI|nr:acyl-CoA N-acyltransferase [Staphylotrichum longicolle]